MRYRLTIGMAKLNSTGARIQQFWPSCRVLDLNWQENGMFGNPSLMTRIAIGKGIGFLLGLGGFILLPHFLPDASLMLRWGILLCTQPSARLSACSVF